MNSQPNQDDLDRQRLVKIFWERRNELPVLTIYHPGVPDGLYIGRVFLSIPVLVQTEHSITADSLDAIRLKVPDSLTRLSRSDEDHPSIIETWI